jgi:hypothetical protein
LAHRRSRSGASVGRQQSEPVEQQVKRPRRTSRRRQGPDGAADLQQHVPFGVIPGAHRRAPGGQVAFARELHVERLEPLRGLKQQGGGIAPTPRGERDPTAQQDHPRALRLVDRSGLGRGQEPESDVERAGLEAGLRGRQGAPRTQPGVRCQHDGAVQESRGGGETAAVLRASGRAFELDGDVLVEPDRRVREVPRAAIRIETGVGRVGQRTVHALAVLQRGRGVHRRSHQRMAERHPLADRQEPVRVCAGRGRRADLQPLGRAPEQHRVPDGLGRRDQQQQPCRGRQRRQPLGEALLDPARQRRGVGQPEPARELGRRPATRELQQRERVALRLRQNPITHPLIKPAGHHRPEQLARIVVVQSAHAELRQPFEISPAQRLARGQYQPD